MQYDISSDFALSMDQKDPLSNYRSLFHIPEKNNQPVIYFCGNSLGLQPKSAFSLFDQEVAKWKNMGVEGHFEGERPWAQYHQHGKKELSHLLGTLEHEVVLLNNLTTNLHVLLASFYRPSGIRKKVIIEKGAFPSDHYAVTTFVQLMGNDPDADVVSVEIEEDGYLSTEKIKKMIRLVGDELALILLPGIQYYTGQWLDMKSITTAAHEVGAYAGFDLAHAIGNVPMRLHDDDVDFATWCSYKYLNSGPGNISGIYINEKHATDPTFPRLGGWWGQQPETRFLMDNVNRPAPSVDGWMMSNGNVLATSIHLTSLQMFHEAGISNLREKSVALTGYLEFLLLANPTINEHIQILTPSNPEERGSQLSIFLPHHGKEIFDYLIVHGVVLDWREPNVIRVAPTPMYNTFSEVYQFVSILQAAFGSTTP
jgi:kynureninase